jgi:hypothetical protein
MTTRRELLKAGATTGLLAFLPSLSSAPSAAAAVGRARVASAPLKRSTFRDALFDDFRVSSPVETLVDLRLVAIADFPAPEAADDEDAFILRFNAPPSTVLAQGTYGLVHPRLGEISLLLVPMGGGEVPECEAVINNRLSNARVIAPRARPHR